MKLFKTKMDKMQDLADSMLAKGIAQVKVIEEILKRFDISNHEACYLLKSGHGDRRIRDIREHLPEGYTMREESHQMRNGKRITSFKRFHLEKIDNIVQAPFGVSQQDVS